MAVPYWLQKLIRPNDVRTLRTTIPYYEVNRERTAVVLKKGLDWYDEYQKAKPYLFTLGLVGMLASGYGWFKRRKACAEAHVLYPTTFTMSTALAYITRPTGKPAAPPPETSEAETAPTEPEPEDSAMATYLDSQVAKEKAKNPNFVEDTYRRVVGLDMIQPTWSQTPEYLKALVI